MKGYIHAQWFSPMGFFQQLSTPRCLAITIGLLSPMIHPQALGRRVFDIATAQILEKRDARRIHSLPKRLDTWTPIADNTDYFQAVSPFPLGYLIWSDRPVSVFVGPSHFTDPSRIKAWDEGTKGAIADWQQFFPLELTDKPNANIVIEQVRPKRTSNGRIRSAQATPRAYCLGDRLAHQFTIQISPSQTSRYIKAATRHELGHALGIWGHSDNPQDVMYQSQVSDPPEISERDINTLKKVYEQPTLLGWSAPQYCTDAAEGRAPDSPR